MLKKRFSTPILITACLLAVTFSIKAQNIEILESGRDCSIRGLSVLNDQCFWLSGTHGSVAYSFNGGKTITWLTVPGFEKRDFRDVEALDAGTAIVMAVDNPAVILKTTDTGRTWKTVYEKNLPGMFLDAMAFENNMHGLCIGDPIDGRFWIVETQDGGDTWVEYPTLQRPEAAEGEALFASSGTNIQFIKKDNYSWGFVSGGLKSRLFLLGDDIMVFPKTIDLILNQGKQSTGANSWATKGEVWVVAGGDFALPLKDSATVATSSNGAQSWKMMDNMGGYKSCVTATANGFVSCGTSGVASIKGNHKQWQTVSKQAFHVVQSSKKGSVVYLAGPKGVVAKMNLEK